MVDKIKTFIMAEDDPEWFINNPILKYLSLKKELLDRFQDESVWGEFGTKKQVTAICSLLDYLKKTRNLADQFPHLLGEVTVGNKNLISQRDIYHPSKFYEQLLFAVVDNAAEEYSSIWDQPNSVTLDKMEKFFERRRISCLAAYQTNVWSETHSHQYSPLEEPCDDKKEASEDNSIDEKKREMMSKARADLRKLRNNISAKMSCRQSTQSSLRKYFSQTEDFIDRFRSELRNEEVETLRKRVDIARNAAKAAPPKVKLRKLSRNAPQVEYSKHIKKVPTDSSSTAENVDDTREKPENVTVDSLSDEVPGSSSYKPQNITDKVDLVLPDVPLDMDIDTDLADIISEDVDEQIEQRLRRLQFFSRA